MGRQLRVQRPPIRNISDLCDRCLNIWYNLSPAIYQGLVASMPRRVDAVLYAQGEPTCDESVRNLSTNLLKRLFGEYKFAFISNQLQKDERDIQNR
ncbi:transposase domain containing protein [Trichonephila clavipes]|nr:transposase domain containing protein [Trichonephila clavipes]